MPWSNNHLPKCRKHHASGQAVVTLKGRDFYLGPHGTKASKVEYVLPCVSAVVADMARLQRITRTYKPTN